MERKRASREKNVTEKKNYQNPSCDQGAENNYKEKDIEGIEVADKRDMDHLPAGSRKTTAENHLT